MNSSLEHLLALLDLEQIEVNLFRTTVAAGPTRRLFGGQVLAQGLVAAGRTVEGRPAHSLHGYFLRPGDPSIPIVFDVDRIRDGGTFTTRRVVAIQHGEAIFNMSVSFHAESPGLEHQVDAPEMGEPSGELYEDELRKALDGMGYEPPDDDIFFHPPIEVRTPGSVGTFDADQRPPRVVTWIRSRGELPDDPAIHQCILAYACDLTILSVALRPHAVSAMSPDFQSATLDHAMWFHRPFRVDDWLYFEQESPVSAGSRGFARGTFYTRAGEVVASCAQEGLMRLRPGATEHFATAPKR